MTPILRRLPHALVAATLLASGAAAADPVAGLPSGAQVVAFLDLAALRTSPAVATLNGPALGDSLPWNATLFGDTDAEGRFDRLAIGGFPVAGGGGMKLALIVDGQWDEAAMTKALLDDGAVEVAIEGHRGYRLPKQADGDDMVVSFLGEGRLAVSDWDLVESVRSGGGKLAPGIASEVSALPEKLSAWVIVADPLGAGAANGVDAGAVAGLANGVRSLGLWARANEQLQLGASALARDAQQATQLSGLLQFGLLGLASQGDGRWRDVASGLRFDRAEDRLSASLDLTPEQVARIVAQVTSSRDETSASGQ